jgi:hypothetical protein
MRKKYAQQARRQVHSVVMNYQTELYEKLERIRVAFRPKPRYVPYFIWLWITKQVVDLGGLKKDDIK